MSNVHLIPCEIEHGGFSRERVFKIKLSETVRAGRDASGVLIGTADIDHLLTESKVPLDEDTPGYGLSIKGFVKCEFLRRLPDGRLAVEVPSADVIHVTEAELVSA